MISKRCIVFLLFSHILLSVLAQKKIRVEKGGFIQKIRNGLVNYIAKKKRYDVKGWIDISKIDHGFNSINIKVYNEKIVCTSGNKIIEVTAKEQKLIEQTDDATYSNVKFNHGVLTKGSNFINPLPVMKSNQYYHSTDFKNALPEDFEGYIVCEKPNSNAVLIPKAFESVEFIAPPWSVKVNVELFKNPVARYGRQFKITILDNVNILMNNKNFFIWPMPFESFSDVYNFHLAVRDSKNGRFCILERNVENFELDLKCESWKKSYSLKLINTYFIGGFIGMNIIQGIAYPLTKHDKIKYYNKRSGLDTYKVMVELNKSVPNHVEVHEDDQSYINDKKKKTMLSIVSNLIYLGIVTMTNVIYGFVKFMQIKKNLEKFNMELEEAQLLYPWRLQYPEMYTSAKNDANEQSKVFTFQNIDVNYEAEDENKETKPSDEKKKEEEEEEEEGEEEEEEEEGEEDYFPKVLERVDIIDGQ